MHVCARAATTPAEAALLVRGRAWVRERGLWGLRWGYVSFARAPLVSASSATGLQQDRSALLHPAALRLCKDGAIRVCVCVRTA